MSRPDPFENSAPRPRAQAFARPSEIEESRKYLILLAGGAGFEPATPACRSGRAVSQPVEDVQKRDGLICREIASHFN